MSVRRRPRSGPWHGGCSESRDLSDRLDKLAKEIFGDAFLGVLGGEVGLAESGIDSLNWLEFSQSVLLEFNLQSDWTFFYQFNAWVDLKEAIRLAIETPAHTGEERPAVIEHEPKTHEAEKVILRAPWGSLRLSVGETRRRTASCVCMACFDHGHAFEPLAQSLVKQAFG